jgi:DNA mismatch repair protein MutH
MSVPPTTEAELWARAKAISGRTIATIAERFAEPVPSSLTRAKGWIGTLIERSLGGDGGSRPEPDFSAIGIELKTLPIDRHGRPRESTFLAVVDPEELARVAWARSRLKKKLTRVLWLPIEADPEIAIGARRVGSPLLWSPSEAEEAILRDDWDRFADWTAHGYLDALTAHTGSAIQIRPKAANSKARRLARDADGAKSLTMPRGFYLRATFTRTLLERSFMAYLDSKSERR